MSGFAVSPSRVQFLWKNIIEMFRGDLFGNNLNAGNAGNGPLRNECEEKWNDGLYTISDHNNARNYIGIRYAHNCRISVDGRLFRLKTSEMRKNDFLEEIPLLTERPVERGIYTYIVYSNDDHKKTFVACKAYSVLEIGTIHRVISYRVNAQRIHAAGEILINADGLFFNFMSGTYMGPIFENEGRKRRSRCALNELEDLLIVKMKEILGSDAQWSSIKTFVTSQRIPVTREELEMYERFGASLAFYDSPDKCFTAKGGRKRRMTSRRK